MQTTLQQILISRSIENKKILGLFYPLRKCNWQKKLLLVFTWKSRCTFAQVRRDNEDTSTHRIPSQSQSAVTMATGEAGGVIYAAVAEEVDKL